MTKLENLIEKLCPNGVEFLPLGDLCEIKTGKGITKKDSTEDGKYPIISGGKEPMGLYHSANREANTVTISRVGANAGFVNFIDVDFYLNDKCFSVIPKAKYKEILEIKFIYEYLKNSEQKIIDMQSEGGVPTINTQKVSSIAVPIPPIEVQREIVRILDNFTELTAELEAELEARKKQYEYYRDELLTFGDDVPKVKLGDIAPLARGTRVIKKQLQSTGTYPVFQNSLTSMGFYHTGNRKANTTFVICAGAAGEIGYSYNEFWAADDCFTFECSEQIISRFLYYALQMQQHILFSRVRKASIPRISRDSIESIAIPVPSLSEQERIVSILDRFDKLCNDITEGLPAEIEARQKQYEYYRDKLLSFKEMS